MRTTRERLLADCTRYCRETGEPLGTMCRKATRDGRTAERLGGSGTITIETVDALYDYMNQRCPAIVNPMIGVSDDEIRKKSSPK